MNGKMLHMAGWILVIVGALNWGLVGVGAFLGANWNVVGLIFGSVPTIEWLVYVLVGAAAVYEIVTHKNKCKDCTNSAGAGSTGATV